MEGAQTDIVHPLTAQADEVTDDIQDLCCIEDALAGLLIDQGRIGA